MTAVMAISSVLIALVGLLFVACAPGGTRTKPASSVTARAAESPLLPRLRPKKATNEPAVVPSALPEPVPPPSEWAYVLPVDQGVRSDESGQGHFLAPRRHGRHNGIDLLAPLATPVLSPCSGVARAGQSPSFGRWVKVVCAVPAPLRGPGQTFASIFFAHLSESFVSPAGVQTVERAEAIGRVGKSGNASGASVMPHLHLELAVLPDERSALSERHYGADHSNSAAAERFFAALESRCLEPNGFWPLLENVRRARRADPFLVLTCLSGEKPRYGPDAELGSHSVPWSALYRARTFDVAFGPG